MKRPFSYLLVLLFLGITGTAFAQVGEIYGTITDETNQPFFGGGATVIVTQGGLNKGGAVTNDDGSYSVKPLQPGSYDIEFRAMNYVTQRITGVVVTAGGSTKLNHKMEKAGATQLGTVVIKSKRYEKPLVNKVQVTTSEEIERMPTRNTNDIASQSTGVYQARNGGALSIGGARADGTVYVIDGMVVSGGSANLAQGTIGQLQVISSGVPANYGDATGGIVAITSKGISNKIHGGIQAQHSIDGYNNNLVNAYATGPLISRMKDGIKKPILGFMVGADFGYDADAGPVFDKSYRLKADTMKFLQQNPLKLVNTSTGPVLQSAAQYVTKDAFETTVRQTNNSSTYFRFNGKLDYALNDNLSVTAGGTFGYSNSQGYNRSLSYFAPDATPRDISYTGRAYVRLTQRFGQQGVSKPEDKAVVSNAFYTIQADYANTYNSREDPDFKRNLFKYGYVGKFKQSRIPVYQSGADSVTGIQGVVLQSLDFLNGLSYEASDLNPVMSNYTKTVYSIYGPAGAITQPASVQGLGGLMNGDFPALVMNTNNQRIYNVGAGMTGYSYNSSSQIGLHIDASFDFKPRKTVHAIQFGLYYEQRTSRGYSVTANLDGYSTNSIWNLMRQLANKHIRGLDYSNPIFIHNGVQYTKEQVAAGSFFLPTDTIIYNRLNTNGSNGYNGTQSSFDRNLRKKLNLNPDGLDYIDIDALDPNQFSLSMFSPDELLNGGTSFVSYYGYDYTGKKLTGQVNFNDFFTEKDANGVYTRPIGTFKPNYIAGYVMDKFRFKDMNFNIGVRIDRYDASTKVLKDPYSLYEAQFATSTNAKFNRANGGQHPDNIGSGYMVYVDNNNSSSPSIIGYRSGDKWFDAQGKQIQDPNSLKEASGGLDPVPMLTDGGKIRITDPNYDPNRSFTDYKPQVNVMPRFQFDFPIADAALFYAHYDVLVQRPKVGNFATPVDYYYLAQNQGNIIGNPDLKPEKTFTYELGFQQALSKNSAVTIGAFYRERKDMIQVRPYLYAWPRTYYTYGNRDFSTTKGFTFKYDYRRTNTVPIQMTLNYTLQFAEGTGSDATSGNGGNGSQVASSGLLQNFITGGLPNLRYVSYLDYDSRHNLSLNVDYRYGDNEGPMVGGKKILENFGANMIFRARSGEPYTTYANVIGNTIEGGLNGTRLPWHFGIDLRIEKSFAIYGFKKPAAGAAPAVAPYSLTAFIYFQNLFNIREVLNVYAFTGRADDDGYVTSPTGQQYFNTQLSPSLQDLYTLYVNNPYNYNGPRRVNIGFLFSF